MANTTVTCPAGEWTLLTDSDVTALRAQNLTARSVVLQATAGASSEPTSTAGGITLDAGEIILPDVTLASLWPGVSGANRVWVRAEFYAASLSVSHG